MVKGNSIGTDANGFNSLGNRSDGVAISGSNNIIGGTESGAGNLIAFNNNGGVFIAAGIGNSVRRNSIFGNAVLGIHNLAANSA
jgi:titin